MGAVTEITDFDSAPKVSNAVMALCPCYRHASETFHERGGAAVQAIDFLCNKKSEQAKLAPTWRRHPDLNWGIKALQASALPLGYGAI